MKRLFIILVPFLLMLSCNSKDNPVEITDNPPLLKTPVDTVMLTTNGETFMIDFSIWHTYTSRHMEIWDTLFLESARMSTRDSLISYYKWYSRQIDSIKDYANQSQLDKMLSMCEYVLAQECFSDRCNSKMRKEILQLVFEKQKTKFGKFSFLNSDCLENKHLPHSIATGVFLMGVILLKEYEHSAEFIDAETLQEALLFLTYYRKYYREDIYGNIYIDINYADDRLYRENFSNLIMECSENFLNNQ
ncbi:MAG: hypothetical protein FWG79_06245 [Bacteroidales bacterium]|nr:hypothetical protein [Bacteroidales bacterium]